ncbi:MAG: DoxX family protein [Alphaproteobacteria bacterium]|nr:MAG: DoxX family protein [Alphaproteobacteria bacterium]
MASTTTDEPRLIIPALKPIYDALSRLSYPMIRFFTGLFLMPHGAQKLFGWFGGYGLEGTGGFMSDALGLEPGIFWAALVGLTEFFGGLFVAIGFLTRPAALGIVIVMAVAVFAIHMPNGFFWNAGGYEYPLYWGLVALAIVFRGGGEMSVDRTLGREI